MCKWNEDGLKAFGSHSGLYSLNHKGNDMLHVAFTYLIYYLFNVHRPTVFDHFPCLCDEVPFMPTSMTV